MRGDKEPTWNDLVHHALEELDQARTGMSAARDWLNSVWWPQGTPLTDDAAEARTKAFALIGAIKGQIDQVKNILWDALAE